MTDENQQDGPVTRASKRSLVAIVCICLALGVGVGFAAGQSGGGVSTLEQGLAQLDKHMASVYQHVLSGQLKGEALVAAINNLAKEKVQVIGAGFSGQTLFGVPASQVIVKFDSIDITLEKARAAAEAGGQHNTAVAGGHLHGAIGIKQKLERLIEEANPTTTTGTNTCVICNQNGCTPCPK